MLLLFGPVADAAGTRKEQIAGSSIEEVLEGALQRFGTAFAEQLGACKIWVNGDVPSPDQLLEESDEVALLPPVSGG
jgi:molybdopterin converting factor small subunit